jgi:hypothetical protein
MPGQTYDPAFVGLFLAQFVMSTGSQAVVQINGLTWLHAPDATCAQQARAGVYTGYQLGGRAGKNLQTALGWLPQVQGHYAEVYDHDCDNPACAAALQWAAANVK